jgi:hypothetical protein
MASENATLRLDRHCKHLHGNAITAETPIGQTSLQVGLAVGDV